MPRKQYDILVVGGGHAGIEAAHVTSRMGLQVIIITMDSSAFGRMSCNPAIGGTAKGHLVKEVDALGGAMGFLADKTGIQFKMLNKSKGPAVWSPRCQSDKLLYSIEALSLLKEIDNIDIFQDTVDEIITEPIKNNLFSHKIKGVKTSSGHLIYCKAVIITAGTFLNAVMYTGHLKTAGGRFAESTATQLSYSLQRLGFETGRLKTGTPPRLKRSTIDFGKTEIQYGDPIPTPFSHRTLNNLYSFPYQSQVPCYLTYTNEETHNILKTGFTDSPLFTGVIKGVGPRYCPSIEDKVHRFADKKRHQIFLEPETLAGETIYMNGFSSSLPAEVQLKAAHTIPGLEFVEMVRPGYAVEYDFFPTHQILPTLETKLVENLYFAGQINGTSGYEEAAAQGIIAGINAALKLQDEEPLILKRNEAYIGVLIDDLINKCPLEPYRMFTSSAEYRLILRQDNADLRLMEKGYHLGLIENQQYKLLKEKQVLVQEGIRYFKATTIAPNRINDFLNLRNSSIITQHEFLSNIIKRNNIFLQDLLMFSDIIKDNVFLQKLIERTDVIQQIEIELKYEGYIKRQQEQIDHFIKNENIQIPPDFKYENIKSLSLEARDKLLKIKPRSIGQASRIAGVTPADIAAILIYMRG
ncbi:MAG: tRNA uridine-5-carboxymethylaminomethyl(34) synthesis enzyme MnmG [Ignavibacteria bacterium]